jgi:hypothetical protein
MIVSRTEEPTCTPRECGRNASFKARSLPPGVTRPIGLNPTVARPHLFHALLLLGLARLDPMELPAELAERLLGRHAAAPLVLALQLEVELPLLVLQRRGYASTLTSRGGGGLRQRFGISGKYIIN